MGKMVVRLKGASQIRQPLSPAEGDRVHLRQTVVATQGALLQDHA
jgi:hypothetical protein